MTTAPQQNEETKSAIVFILFSSIRTLINAKIEGIIIKSDIPPQSNKSNRSDSILVFVFAIVMLTPFDIVSNISIFCETF